MCARCPVCVRWDCGICHWQPGESRLVHVPLLMKVLCITDLANRTINLAEKLKMQMAATACWFLHNLSAAGAYGSREVRELY